MNRTTFNDDDLAWAAVGGDAYVEATTSFNLAPSISPGFAATVKTIPEVQAILAAASARDLQVRVHATGHAAGGAAPFCDEDMLIRVRMAGEVSVDPAAKSAVIPAGSTWGEVIAAASPHGLAPLHGSSPSVGAIGYLLGGGLSLYGRRYGVASNSVTSITLVTADGSVVTVDHRHDRALFDALRGGGGGFGVVVSATIDLIEADAVFTGATFWPASEAAYVLEAWEKWAEKAPWVASTAFRVMSFPPVPGIPPQLTAGPVVCIDGAVLDEAGRTGAEIAAELLEPLRRRTQPLFDTWHAGVPTDVAETHMDPPEPLPFHADHQMLTRLGAEGREALLSIAGTTAGSSLVTVELRQLGGAFSVPDPRGGVVNSLPGSYAALSVGVLAGPVTGPSVLDQLSALRKAMGPWDTGLTVPTFVEQFDAPQKSFDAGVAAKVGEVRRRVDPKGLFSGDVAAQTLTR
ncbi:FAD-binding protein [Paenarthrobacter sp. CM16]|uniref:FAD-binding protein n=1 Tax=Paenarthrobacter sp. CM16 TaxID=2738447 RepID=UPI00155418C8|nr:FAD-binding protein [Paenarthrobacter sp. CM16]NQD87596.1 FAD-binding protein [Paenarthrobacter sp. CM16]